MVENSQDRSDKDVIYTPISIIDFVLSEDVQELIKCNPDVRLSAELKDKINSFQVGTMLKVVKVIDRGINIISVDEVTEDFINKEIF